MMTLDKFLPLIGVVIGGIIGILSTWLIAERKWVHEKKDRLQEDRRAAVGKALAWLNPIQDALTNASLLTSGYQRGMADEDKLRKEWPRLLEALAARDLPPEMQIHVSDAYQLGLGIIRGLDELRMFNLAVGAGQLPACLDALSDLERQQRTLESLLTEAYLKTYQ